MQRWRAGGAGHRRSWGCLTPLFCCYFCSEQRGEGHPRGELGRVNWASQGRGAPKAAALRLVTTGVYIVNASSRRLQATPAAEMPRGLGKTGLLLPRQWRHGAPSTWQGIIESRLLCGFLGLTFGTFLQVWSYLLTNQWHRDTYIHDFLCASLLSNYWVLELNIAGHWKNRHINLASYFWFKSFTGSLSPVSKSQSFSKQQGFTV